MCTRSGLVESRLRQLVMMLETIDHLQVAHPYIKGIEKVTKCFSDKEGVDAAHGIYPAPKETPPSTDTPTNTPPSKVETPSSSVDDNVSKNNDVESLTNEQQQLLQQQENTPPSSLITSPPVVTKTVYTTTFYIGLQIAPKDTSSNAPRKLDITWPTQEFVNKVKLWDHFDEATMGIVVQYIKR